MKYFLHDTNAFNDEKVTELFIKYGYEGIGLFYSILEKIASQEKPIKTEVLKKQLQIGKKLDKVWSFLEQIDLISTKNGETFNERILSYSEKYQVKKEKNAEKVRKWREDQHDTKIVTSNETITEPVSNPPKEKKESKESKEEEEIPSPPLKVNGLATDIFLSLKEHRPDVPNDMLKEEAKQLIEKYKLIDLPKNGLIPSWAARINYKKPSIAPLK